MTNDAPKANIKQAAVKKSRVSGVILVDKPQGLTSQQVVSKVKYLFKSAVHDSKKAGHTGTLDPMATGLLPVCLGEATKFSHYQLDANKSYEATIQLGQRTNTGDADGEIVQTQPIPAIDDAACQQVMAQFLGAQQQMPPMYSALKKDGKKLYEYAREGVEVERPSRPITIHQLQLQRIASDTLRLSVTCSKGTYVRVLGEDIAQALGTVGHLTMLRRTQVGHFDIANALTLAELEALEHSTRFDYLLDIDACIVNMPSLTVSEEQCQRLLMGQRLNVKAMLDVELVTYLQQVQKSADIKLVNTKGVFLGLAVLEASGRLQPKKMIQR